MMSRESHRMISSSKRCITLAFIKTHGQQQDTRRTGGHMAHQRGRRTGGHREDKEDTARGQLEDDSTTTRGQEED